MKRIGGLFDTIASMDNLEKAAKKACTNRKDKLEVARFMSDREANIERMHKSLVEDTFEVSRYRYFDRFENGKCRHIADLPLYPDRIVHQAFEQVLGPALDRTFIDQTHASRRGRGIHSALTQARGYLSRYPKLRYCLAMDISKCYESLDKEILVDTLSRHIKDPRVMHFLEVFIRGYPRQGIPIGDCLSSLYCNLYLSGVDHYAKEVLKCHCYIRYADNIYVFGNSKQWLRSIHDRIVPAIESLNLRLKDNWTICDLSREGVDFLGYRLYRDYVLLRRSTKVRLKRSMSRIMARMDDGHPPDCHDRGSIASYRGVLKWCDSYRLCQATI